MGPMRRVMVGFEAPNAPVEAAWARLRYPTSTQAKFANGSLEGDGRSTRVEGDGRSTRVDLAAALRLLAPAVCPLLRRGAALVVTEHLRGRGAGCHAKHVVRARRLSGLGARGEPAPVRERAWHAPRRELRAAEATAGGGAAPPAGPPPRGGGAWGAPRWAV